MKKSSVLATGLAMFSMFFGAGNVVFPLALGQYAQGENFFAVLGLLITAVGVPFLGLMAMMLYDGDYRSFFNRMGKVPGFFTIVLIMALIGPLGALPRCIALSYATFKMYLPDLSLFFFSASSCLLIFLLTVRKSRVVDLLGYVLTPFLLLSLVILIVKGLWTSSELNATTLSSAEVFTKGLHQGYQTMDLICAFFFSGVILSSLKREVKPALQASVIGASLLGLIYVGFSYVAAVHSDKLAGVSQEQLLGTLAFHILGPYAGLIAGLAVALACLTTAVALAVVFAEFLQKDLARKKISYQQSLIVTLVGAGLVSTLNFSGIVSFLAPILEVCYPALILLTLVNLVRKLGYFPALPKEEQNEV